MITWIGHSVPYNLPSLEPCLPGPYERLGIRHLVKSEADRKILELGPDSHLDFMLAEWRLQFIRPPFPGNRRAAERSGYLETQ